MHLPLLETYFYSKDITERYNHLVKYLNSLPVLPNMNEYLNAVWQFYNEANTAPFFKPDSDQIDDMMLKLKYCEDLFDQWAVRNLPNGYSTRPAFVPCSHLPPQSFFAPAPAPHKQPQSNFTSNACFGLAICGAVLGFVGLIVAVDPLTWIIGLTIFAVSPPAFIVLASLYIGAMIASLAAAAVLTCVGIATHHDLDNPSPQLS